MSKKLIYITTRLPWPQDNGRKVTLYNYCRGLHELCGYEIFLYSFLDADQNYDPRDKPPFIAEVEIALPIGKAEKFANVAKALFKPSEPWQNCLYFSKANANAIRKFADRVHPDALIVDMVRLAPYICWFSDIDCMKSLDIDDLLSRRYKRQMGRIESRSFLGSYSSMASKGTDRLLSLAPVRNLVLKTEARRMEKAEFSYSRQFDSVFFVSPKDAETFSESTGLTHCFSAGMGADVDYLSENVQVSPQPDTAAFVGNLAFDANVASVKFVVDDVIPKMKHAMRLRVIGGCPERVKQDLSERSCIDLLGRVEDLRTAVKGSEVFLAPIAYGSGIKTKIVEALAMGMCVVTNSIGAEGLEARNGAEIVIEDDPVLLAQKMDELLDNPDMRKTIAMAGQAYAMRKHRWDDLLRAFSENGF